MLKIDLFVVGFVITLLRILYVLEYLPDVFNKPIIFQSYKDIAHIFVGFVLGLAVIKKERWLWIFFWFLNVVEVICAVIS